MDTGCSDFAGVPIPCILCAREGAPAIPFRIMQFKKLSRHRYLEWLRWVKPEKWAVEWKRLSNET